MLGFGEIPKRVFYKVSIEKNIYLYIFDFFICIVSVHTWLFPSSFVHFFIALRLYCMHCIHFWEKALFTSLLICIVSVHLITCTRCTRCTLFLFLVLYISILWKRSHDITHWHPQHLGKGLQALLTCCVGIQQSSSFSKHPI